MRAVLVEPERANLLAVIIHRLVSKSPAELPPCVWRLKAGGMIARLTGGPQPRVESGEGRGDCSIEAALVDFIRLGLGDSPVRAWLTGRVILRGNPFRALPLMKVFRCRS